MPEQKIESIGDVIKALEAEHCHVGRAAKRLGVTRETVYEWLKRYNLRIGRAVVSDKRTKRVQRLDG